MADNEKDPSLLMEMCVQTFLWHYYPYYYFSSYLSMAAYETTAGSSLRY
jgi:dolichyl-phosphate-mannose--protein O-mannosyl transferase